MINDIIKFSQHFSDCSNPGGKNQACHFIPSNRQSIWTGNFHPIRDFLTSPSNIRNVLSITDNGIETVER